MRPPVAGSVRFRSAPAIPCYEGHPMLFLEEQDVEAGEQEAAAEIDLDAIRPDLAEAIERHRYSLDENRSERVARRHAKGQRTARENIDGPLRPRQLHRVRRAHDRGAASAAQPLKT